MGEKKSHKNMRYGVQIIIKTGIENEKEKENSSNINSILNMFGADIST